MDLLRGWVDALRDDPLTTILQTLAVFVLIAIFVIMAWFAFHAKPDNGPHYTNEFCRTESVFDGFAEINKMLIPQYRSVTTCITPMPATATRSPQ